MKKIYAKMATAFFIAFTVTSSNVSAVVGAKETQISQDAYDACVEYGEAYGICPEMLMAIIEKESNGNPNAVGKLGEIGLMQIYPDFHQDRMKKLGITSLYSERQNVFLGADYLKELSDEYGDISLVLDIYNGNSKAFENYENGVISDYAKGILERSAELERVHGK